MVIYQIYLNYKVIGLMSRVFVNGPGDWCSIPSWVIPKTQKMVLDAALLSTQHNKVRIKGKVEQSREWSSALGVVAFEKGGFGSPLTKVNLIITVPNYQLGVIKTNVHKKIRI